MSTAWYVIAGVLLIGMALAGTVLKRLPLTAAMFYLAAGATLGPWGVGLLRVDAIQDASWLERLTEVAVIISLFTAGLKLRLPASDRRWRVAILLATVAMMLTIGGIAAFAHAVVGLPLGAAVLLGALLAPTDPVLASDVQVEHEHDAEPVRVGLTGEAGLNDGSAFPFVVLGLGLMGAHDLRESAWHWLAIDLAWALAGNRSRVGGGGRIGRRDALWRERREAGAVLAPRASRSDRAGRVPRARADRALVRTCSARSGLRVSRGVRGGPVDAAHRTRAK